MRDISTLPLTPPPIQAILLVTLYESKDMFKMGMIWIHQDKFYQPKLLTITISLRSSIMENNRFTNCNFDLRIFYNTIYIFEDSQHFS